MSYLEQIAGEATMNELRLWLSGSITRADFFTRHPHHSLADLRRALKEGVKEVDVVLDRQLFRLIAIARNDYHIELNDDAFFDGRKIDVEELRHVNVIERLGRRHTVRCLQLIQAELEWENNEIGRLQVHMTNAAEMTAAKIRNSFSYHPLPRRVLSRELRVQDHIEMVQESSQGTEDGEIVESESDEEERNGEVDHGAAVRRDSIAMDVDDVDMGVDENEYATFDVDGDWDHDSDKENLM
jgi:hypothetical protein